MTDKKKMVRLDQNLLTFLKRCLTNGKCLSLTKCTAGGHSLPIQAQASGWESVLCSHIRHFTVILSPSV